MSTFLAHAAAGGLSPSQMSDGLEEVLGTSGLDTVAPKEARPLCELERSLRIQRMATPVPVEMEQPLAETETETERMKKLHVKSPRILSQV